MTSDGNYKRQIIGAAIDSKLQSILIVTMEPKGKLACYRLFLCNQ